MLQDTPAGFLWLAAGLAVPSLLYLFVTNILIGRGQILQVHSRGTPLAEGVDGLVC